MILLAAGLYPVRDAFIDAQLMRSAGVGVRIFPHEIHRLGILLA